MNKLNEISRIRYSDEDLAEFKAIIDRKLEESREQLEDLKEQLTELNNSGDENRAGTFDDGASNWQREHLNKLASRQQRFIRDLEHALIRIKNKTYGICSITGQLIEKQRLLLVPHATKTVEGKTQQSSRKTDKKRVSTGGSGLENEKPKKVITKVVPGGKEEFEEDLDAIDEEDFIEDFSEPQDDY
jgi:RNA polymerase-binding transcription factor DksA